MHVIRADHDLAAEQEPLQAKRREA